MSNNCLFSVMYNWVLQCHNCSQNSVIRSSRAGTKYRNRRWLLSLTAQPDEGHPFYRCVCFSTSNKCCIISLIYVDCNQLTSAKLRDCCYLLADHQRPLSKQHNLSEDRRCWSRLHRVRCQGRRMSAASYYHWLAFRRSLQGGKHSERACRIYYHGTGPCGKLGNPE